MKQKTTGIYTIKNKITNVMYIGQSIDVKIRWNYHRNRLQKKCHDNSYLQRAWNKYGEDNFEFFVLEICAEADLDLKEQEWIDKTKLKYNISEDIIGGRLSLETRKKMSLSAQGEKNHFFGKNHTPETKKKMSAKKIGLFDCEKNPNFGNRWNESQKNKMRGSKNKNAKLKESDVLEIRRLLQLGSKHEEIAKLYKVSRTVITRINSGTRWSHLKESPNARL